MSSKKRLKGDGSEILDSKPMEIPVGFRRPPSMEEQLRRFVRMELSADASSRGQETFEESEYFGEDQEDADFSTPYEMEFHPGLGKDVTRAEMAHIREGEREFDKKYKEYKDAQAKERAEIVKQKRRMHKARYNKYVRSKKAGRE